MNASFSFHTSIVATWAISWLMMVKKRSPGVKVSIEIDSGATSSSRALLGVERAPALAAQIEATHITEAIGYRSLDRKLWAR